MVLSLNNEEIANSSKNILNSRLVCTNHTLFQTQMTKKPYPLMPHMPIQPIYGSIPPGPGVRTLRMSGQGNRDCAYTRPTAVQLNFASLNQTKLPKSLPILESPLILRLMLNCLAGKENFVYFIFWSVNSQFPLYIAANLQSRLKPENC